ncbi:MAG: NHL repeat-containing protein [Ignavibacterium sp.]|jgi:hypothetical protein|nr:NHL repeat-containing protein [Ignavibacterium sp.]
MYRIFVLIVFLSVITPAQKFEINDSYGDFNNAVSFYITANGLIYVCDKGDDEIILLDTLGNVLKTFGGYGWTNDSFDDPADIFADPLSVYVSDKNNNSIKRFDKNLNFVSSFNRNENSSSEEQFGFPLSVAVSNQGDLYLIDSDNRRVIKFDIYGNFFQNFGGIDAGKFQLKNPSQLAISSANNIYVIDNRDIFIFDNFGNGITKLQFENTLQSIRILFNNLIITDVNNNVFFSNLKSSTGNVTRLDLNYSFENTNISSAIILNSKLYILTDKNILVFSKID